MLKRKVITSKIESIDCPDCQINQTSPGDLDLYLYLPLYLKPQGQISFCFGSLEVGKWCSSWSPSCALLKHFASLQGCCLLPETLLSDPITLSKGSAVLWGELDVHLAWQQREKIVLEPGNLQECRAAVLLSQLQTCFARGSPLCRVGGMRHVLPSRTSVLQTNRRPLSHQQSQPGNGQAAGATRKPSSFLLTERGGGRIQVIIRATHSNFGEASVYGLGSYC